MTVKQKDKIIELVLELRKIKSKESDEFKLYTKKLKNLDFIDIATLLFILPTTELIDFYKERLHQLSLAFDFVARNDFKMFGLGVVFISKHRNAEDIVNEINNTYILLTNTGRLHATE